jgi:tetrapyrrole methylase family protein/MazG family protein
MRPKITVVGLGPGGVDLLSQTTSDLLRSAATSFLRTAQHPASAAFPGIPTFDRHYEDAATFEEVYERIVVDLVAAAQVVSSDGGSVVYAVPGSPLVAERTVELLRADPRVDLDVVPAMSFLDLAWARLGVDPVAMGVRLVDGTRFVEEAAGERGPLLVAQCWSSGVVSDVKLAIGDAEPPHELVVTVLHHLGLPDETVVTVPWYEVDRAVVPDHLTSLWLPELAAPVASELSALDELVRRLRRDCPWDRQQTHASLTRHLLEESYEVIDAIDSLVAASDADAQQRASAHLEEELGDVLFQVFIHSRLAAEEGRFTIADVARGLHEKLVSRHPHVFGDVAAHDAATVVANWEQIKKAEKGRESVTDGIPGALPALALSVKLQRKAAGVAGMSAPSLGAIRARASALIDALGTEVPPASETAVPSASSEKLRRAGALLWVVADLVRRSGVEPEDALRAAARQFADEIRDAEARQAN